MKKIREKRVSNKSNASGSASVTRPKCDKRRTRERRRNSVTNNHITSTDGSSSGEELDGKLITENGLSTSKDTTSSGGNPLASGIGTAAPRGGSKATAAHRARIWIRCQSDLDADCEDNSTDFDSISHCAFDCSPSHNQLNLLPLETEMGSAKQMAASENAAESSSLSNETETLREKIELLET
ncbi:unnamed protein product, partial [Anisakis simplex]